MQKGGNIPIFRGLPRNRMRGTGFISSSLGKIFNTFFTPAVKNTLKRVGMRTIKSAGSKIAQNIIESGPELMQGKFKKAGKNMLKKSKKDLIAIGKHTLADELAKYQKGGLLLSSEANRKTRLRKRITENRF